MRSPSTLPADFFDKPETERAPDWLPADFFFEASHQDDPLLAQPKTAAELPSRAAFEASHQAAVARAVASPEAAVQASAPPAPSAASPGGAGTPAPASGAQGDSRPGNWARDARDEVGGAPALPLAGA